MIPVLHSMADHDAAPTLSSSQDMVSSVSDGFGTLFNIQVGSVESEIVFNEIKRTILVTQTL